MYADALSIQTVRTCASSDNALSLKEQFSSAFDKLSQTKYVNDSEIWYIVPWPLEFHFNKFHASYVDELIFDNIFK